jgi:hypothetical protein
LNGDEVKDQVSKYPQKIFSSDLFKDRLATIILISVFGLILIMLFIHIWSISFIMTKEDIAGFQEIEKANINLFSILLPLFGAWIGTVIAFYYGKENLNAVSNAMRDNVDKAYNSLSDAHKSIDKMAGVFRITSEPLGEVISKNPESMNIRTAKLTSTIKEIIDIAGDGISNVLIVDDKEQPLGLLFVSDINKLVASREGTISDFYNTPLRDFLNSNKLKDNVTGEDWTVNGVKNYVILDITDTAEQASKKLQDSKLGLSARGIVLDNDKKPFAIITYELLVVK